MNKNTESDSTINKYNFFLILFGAIVGVVFSGILIRHHVDPNASGSFVQQMCGTDANSGCGLVNQSALSSFLGMPIAFWGFLLYGTVVLTTAFYLYTREIFLLQKVLWMSFFAALVDIILLGYSVLILKTICRLCVITYLGTLVMLMGVVFEMLKKKSEHGLLPEFKSVKNIAPGLWVLFAVLFSLLPLSGWYLGLANPAPVQAGIDPQMQKMIDAAFEDYYAEYKKADKVDLSGPEAPIKGNPAAKLEFVEFADPLCPYCALYAVKMKELVMKYPDKISVRFRHYPLDKNCNSGMQRQLHEGACALSAAKVCAGEQGKFWEMHDSIFTNQRSWSDGAVTLPKLGQTASSLGLNEKQFMSCMNSNATKARVSADLNMGNKAGVTGTPTLFANGRKMPGLRVEFFDLFMSRFIEREAR
ncbi:MAG: thioredoxin domain-containing protein [Leptospiraceae bacterium]|nr:thioredoxin domain-containing protein [Leptospiraceae bacterium]